MTAESQDASRDSLQSQYDAKIDVCFAEIRRLREARNADCSHSRKLPREVLTMIFGILAERDNYIQFYPLPSQIGWVVVTHVCRTWRRISLSEPRLWTDLSDWSTSPSRWVNELFLRSKAAPLSLRVRGDISDCYQRICDQMLQSPERFKSLTVSDKKEYLLGLTKPMPYLEKLSVGNHGFIPDNFAGGYAPRLRCLELSSVIVPLNASWFPNVQKLSLSGEWSPTDAGCQPTVKSFLALLSRLPHLVDLNVTMPKNMDATICPGDVVRLRLKTFRVFVGLSVPAFKEILKFTVVDTLQKFDVVLSDNFGGSAIPDTVNFFVANTGIQPDTIQMKESEMKFIIRENEAFKEYSLRLDACRRQDPLPQLSLCHLDNIKTLQLSRHCWRPSFPMPACQTIEEIQFQGFNVLDELMTLVPSDTIPLAYPSLRRLQLRQVDFAPKSKMIPRLKRWINERKKIFALEKLTVEKCDLGIKDINLLSKTIPVDAVY